MSLTLWAVQYLGVIIEEHLIASNSGNAAPSYTEKISSFVKEYSSTCPAQYTFVISGSAPAGMIRALEGWIGAACVI